MPAGLQSARLSSIRPVAANRPGTLSRLLRAWRGAIAGYFVRRAAVASLGELDDRALQDIGLVRCQIEAAAHGFITRPDLARL